jgi:8-hydroxy-5-deazaflavin:NADPH oxidoreductase
VKIGIVGGTGDIGEGMALRLSLFHTVLIGSREEEKAYASSEECIGILTERGVECALQGVDNQEAVDASEIVILAIPYKHLVGTLQSLSGFENKIVISPVNPIERSDHFYHAPPPEGSAALLIRKMLPESAKICAAFNNIAANRWRALDDPLNYSVAVCGDDTAAKRTVMDLASEVINLKPFDAGPLAAASMVEGITPVLLNVAKFNKMRDVGIQFI